MRDFLFLRNQLFRDKEVICDVWLQSGKPGISQEANEMLFKFPETEDELFEYDCIVAFDPDWEQLDEMQVKLLERWVAEKAGGLIVVAGPVFTPQWSSRRRGDPRIDTLKALYPVVVLFPGLRDAQPGPVRLREVLAAAVHPRRPGGRVPLARRRRRHERSGLAAVRRRLRLLRREGPQAGARVYARFGDPDTAIDNVQPIYMAGQFYGSGRVFFLASGEMWRVRRRR